MSKVILVTGAGRGLGTHIARESLGAGHQVVATGRRPEEVEKTLGGPQDNLLVTKLDVTSLEDAEAAAQAAVNRFGRIDVLINNAALFAPLPEQKCTEIEADLWDRVMAVNLRGPFLMVKHVVPHMIAQGYGKIINVGSGTAFRGIPWMLHYVTSKGGIMAFTRALARELGEHGVRVNTLAPGFTLSDTVMRENPVHVATARERAVQSRALKRDEQPQDLLGALIFLASAESDFVTGQTIAVDGGNVNT